MSKKKIKVFRHSDPSPDTQDPLKPPPTSPTPRLNQFINKKKFFIITIALLSFLLFPAAATGIGLYWYISSFTQAAGLTNHELLSTIRAGYSTQIAQTNKRTNLLILGIDQIVGQKDNSLLTDTIIITSVDLQSGKITLIPLPRDLWIEPFQTKINAIYYYGEISDETSGQEFTSKITSQVTGLPIHYVFVIRLQTLERIIDGLGGVNLDVPKAFSDNKFPRSDVDINQVTDPNLLYETIAFSQGPQHMDGATALKYIRSRSSHDLSEGTDLARSKRQLQLIQAIINQLLTRKTLSNPHLLGNLYRIYHQEIETNLQDHEAISLTLSFFFHPPQLSTLNLPVQQNGQPGLFYHPPVEIHQQWVYEPTDPTWKDIHDYIASQLNSR